MYSAAVLLFAAAASSSPSVKLTVEPSPATTLNGVTAAVGQTLGEDGMITYLPWYLEGSTYFHTPPFPKGGVLTLTCPSSGTASGASTCQTAYARDPTTNKCFDELGDFSNWGWSNIVSGSTTIPLYSAAGQCVTSKGWHSADLVIEYVINVGIRLTYVPLTGQSINEVHMYVGKDPLPKKNGAYTTAPGQYPVKFSDGTLTHLFAFDGLEDGEQFYVVAHAVVCGAPPVQSCPCTFYLATVKCAPCSAGIDGGLGKTTSHDAWASRSCGPRFTILGGSGNVYNTVVYKKQINDGDEETVKADADALLMGVYAVGCGQEIEWCPIPNFNGPVFHACPCGEFPTPNF